MTDITTALQTLIDRQEIYDCLIRYCRGLDRYDRELLLSVYHPDAIDDHNLFVGGPEQFVDWAFDFHRKHMINTLHSISNHTCEIEGLFAHTETYYFYGGMNTQGATLSLQGGRYIDRFEKRNGRWAILTRKVVTDWLGVPADFPLSEENRRYNLALSPAHDRSDVSYERPLQISATRLAARAPVHK